MASGEKCLRLGIGLDIGSTATKLVVLGDGGAVEHTDLMPTGFSSVDAAARALASAREAVTTDVAPESLWAVRDGALAWGAAEDELPSGTATLVLDLARTLGVAVTRDPGLADAVAAGEDPDAQVLLVSDEHGVVPASSCDDELARRLAQGYATLLEKASRRPFGA